MLLILAGEISYILIEWYVAHEIKSALPFNEYIQLVDAEFTGWATTLP